jgi:hypothetical protein
VYTRRHCFLSSARPRSHSISMGASCVWRALRGPVIQNLPSFTNRFARCQSVNSAAPDGRGTTPGWALSRCVKQVPDAPTQSEIRTPRLTFFALEFFRAWSVRTYTNPQGAKGACLIARPPFACGWRGVLPSLCGHCLSHPVGHHDVGHCHACVVRPPCGDCYKPLDPLLGSSCAQVPPTSLLYGA